jgi:hypothetical protein
MTQGASLPLKRGANLVELALRRAYGWTLAQRAAANQLPLKPAHGPLWPWLGVPRRVDAARGPFLKDRPSQERQRPRSLPTGERER